MAIEQQPTLQAAEDAIKAGKAQQGENILKQILETTDGEFDAGSKGLLVRSSNCCVVQARKQKRL